MQCLLPSSHIPCPLRSWECIWSGCRKNSNSLSIGNVGLWVDKFFLCCNLLNLCSIRVWLSALGVTQARSLRGSTLRGKSLFWYSGWPTFIKGRSWNIGRPLEQKMMCREWDSCRKEPDVDGVSANGVLSCLCIFHLAVCITRGIKALRRIK